MHNQYFVSKNKTLAMRLDEAWDDYKNNTLPENERLKALDFMIYAFDIKNFSNDKNNLNMILNELMSKREKKKQQYPDYIPTLTLERYNLAHSATSENVNKAIQMGLMLDVNTEDKKEDKSSINPATYLTRTERAEYDIEIYNGLMHKNGRVFDSSNFIAHEKQGYVAFTLNTDGRLSVFKHLSGKKDNGKLLFHSSMNAGDPVLCAGEMQIEKGKLISINTYSGHYKPSLYSVARFLEYLSAKGVDISKTKIYLYTEPSKDLNLNYTTREFNNRTWFEVPASEIVKSVKGIMKSNLHSLEDYLQSTKTKIFRDVFRSSLTQKKSTIAENFYCELSCALNAIQDSSSSIEIKASLDFLESILTKYSNELKNLNAKSGRLDHKFAEMKTKIVEAKTKLGSVDETDENRRIESFKKNK